MDITEKGQDVLDEAATVKDSAASTAAQVRDEAVEQVRSVADTTKEQAKQTAAGLGQGLQEEAGKQAQRAAELLDGLGGELEEMSYNGTGWAASLVGDAGGRTRDLAHWMQRTDPQDMLGAVEDFARRRPLVFVGASALAGLLVGRLTRSLMASSNGNGSTPRAIDTELTYPDQPADPLPTAATDPGTVAPTRLGGSGT